MLPNPNKYRNGIRESGLSAFASKRLDAILDRLLKTGHITEEEKLEALGETADASIQADRDSEEEISVELGRDDKQNLPSFLSYSIQSLESESEEDAEPTEKKPSSDKKRSSVSGVLKRNAQSADTADEQGDESSEKSFEN